MIVVSLLATKRSTGFPQTPVCDTLTAKRFWRCCFRRIENGADIAPAWVPSGVIGAPLLFMLLASFNFGLLALVFQFVETVFAAAVFDGWPVFGVYLLMWFTLADTEYTCSIDAPPRRNTAEHAALFLLAASGLLFIFSSLSEDIERTGRNFFHLGLVALVWAVLELAACMTLARMLLFDTLDGYGYPRPLEQYPLVHMWWVLRLMTILRVLI